MRLVSCGAAVESSGWPRRMSSTGIASAPSARTDSTTAGTRCRVSRPTQRAPSVGLAARGPVSKFLPFAIRAPANPSSAGTSVSETATATATVPAAASPIAVMNGIPTTASEARAITTVAPAKTTALPAVATARAADSSGSIPANSCARWREMMNSA